MHETAKPSFFHTTEFNVWLITSFFQVFISVFFVILPIAGIHSLGVAAGEELSRYGTPEKPAVAAPKPEPPIRRMEGVPVAFRTSGSVP